MSRSAGTIAARNYLAQVRVLARSISDVDPSLRFSTLLIDGTEADRSQPGIGSVVLPGDLGLKPEQLHSMMLIYDVMELATALKPALLSLLLRTSTVAAYFDPDIRLFAALDDVFETAESAGIALTPHTLDPMPRDGKNLAEKAIMQAGIYNLGFIAVAQHSRRFLNWWHERLVIDAISDVENALFTDQRWIDWVPALFPHEISRDRGLNVAYWNLHERPLSVRDGVVHAGDDRLRFFHFSGFDPATPWLLSKHVAQSPRVLMSDSPELAALCESYRAELEEFGHIASTATPYGHNVLPNGLPLTRRIRRMVRRCIIGELAGHGEIPDAFADPDEFARWLNEPAWSTAELSPARFALWNERTDVQAAFPDPFGVSSTEFARWCVTDPFAVEWLTHMQSFVRPEPRESSTAPNTRQPQSFGWTVVAYANAELGVGEAGRRTADAVAASGVPMELLGTALGSLSRQKRDSSMALASTPGFENFIACVNADQLPRLASSLALEQLRGYRVGLWFWELEQFPDRFERALSLVDEVWVASEFTRLAIQAATEKHVRKIVIPIDIPVAPTAFTRRSVGLPEDRFVFLTNFDFLSVAERKNPAGVVKAYMDAFGADDGACLVVKSINSVHRPFDSEYLKHLAAARPDVVFLEDYVMQSEMTALIELADVFVSLHRSEGFGLNLADAMAVGTPVIATGYAGNLDFMTESNSILIPYTLSEVGPSAGPYDASAVWANPDQHAASTAMRQVFHEYEDARARAARARGDIAHSHSVAVASESMRPVLLGQDWRS